MKDNNERKTLKKQSKIRKADPVNEHHTVKTYSGNGSKALDIVKHYIRFL